MPSPREQTIELLELLAGEPVESARAAARSRLARLVADERRALEARAASVGSEAFGRRGAAARCAARVAALGRPIPSPLRPDVSAARLGRRLVGASKQALVAIATDLGRVEAAMLCRDMDDGSAGRLARRLGLERGAVGALARLAPARHADLVRFSCRRLATARAGGAEGTALVEALGRSLLAAVVAWGEPDTAAALGRRLGPLPIRVEQAVEWIAAVVSLVDERRLP